MQVIVHGNLDEIIGRETDVRIVAQVVGGVVMTRTTGSGSIRGRRRVVSAVGEILEHQKRMRRASLAQIDLDRRRRPLRPIPDRDEVDAESTDHSLARELASDANAISVNLAAVRGIGGEGAAEVDLTGWSAQQLVVGRDHACLTQWIDTTLHRWRSDLIALEELLDNAAHGREFGDRKRK